MKPLSPSGQIKLWFLTNEWRHGVIGIGMATIAVAAVFAGVAHFGQKTGPSMESEAVIVSVGNWMSDTGNHPRVTVRLPDGKIDTLWLERTHHCRLGDTVIVSTTPTRSGVERSIVGGGCGG